MKKVEINNMPKKENWKEFTVARQVDGEWWYWVTTDNMDIAIEEAFDNNGLIFHRDWIKA